MLKVGLIQTRAYSSNQEGISRISKLLKILGNTKTRIVCLPEQWLKNNEIDDFDSEFKEFKEIAKDYEMTIIPGAFYQKNTDGCVITSPIIGPNGDIVGSQEKIHPYDYEKKSVVSGKEAKVFKTSCKFGIIICYDMVFPRVSETLVKKGAQVLFSPSRIVRRGISPWKAYVQVRSLENRVPILAANVLSRKYGGNSMIIDLKEMNKVVIPKISTVQEEGFATKKINLSKFEKARKLRYSDTKNFI